MSKRQKFVATSIILTICFFLFQAFDVLFRYESTLVIILLSVILTFWSLRAGLKFDAVLLSLALPILFTAGIGFFFFLLHSVLISRLLLLFYAVGMYAALLSSNIYAVASLRTIALLRTAHAIGLFLILLSSFFLFDYLFSFRSFPWVNGAVAGLIAFPLSLQSLWSVELDERIKPQVLQLALVTTLGIAQIAFMLSLWPVTVTVGSLFLTTILYVLLGLGQSDLQGRLFARTIKEYLFVGLVVFIAVYLSARWGG